MGEQTVSAGKQREIWGMRAGLIGFGINMLLFAAKLSAGLIYGSIAIVADAINNLSDSASSAITFFGFRLAAKPADKEHPYGHARMEYVSGFLVSIIVVFLGLQLAKSSIEKVLSPSIPEVSPFMLIVLIASIIVKAFMWVMYSKLGRRISSETLKAASIDSRNDVLTTGAILISVIIFDMTGTNLDGVMGVAVSVLIIILGVRLVLDTMSPLIGVAPAREMVSAVTAKILSYEGVIGIHDLAIHTYGYGKNFASAHCEVSAQREIMESHDLADNIEREVKRDLDINLVIHLDPVETGDQKTMEMRERVITLLADISPRLSMHDFRAVWSLTHSNFIFDVVVPFDFDMTEEELDNEISEAIGAIDQSYYAVISFDRDYVPM